MPINKLLKDQDAWLKQAPQSFKLQPAKIEDMAMLKSATEQRIAQLTQRVDHLSKAREAAVQRFDEAITAEKGELERLRKDLKNLPSVDR